MTSDDLTAEQLAALLNGIGPGRRYLRRLEERMCAAGFRGDDELAKLVTAAHNAVDRLWVRLHYLNCEAYRPGSTLQGGARGRGEPGA